MILSLKEQPGGGGFVHPWCKIRVEYRERPCGASHGLRDFILLLVFVGGEGIGYEFVPENHKRQADASGRHTFGCSHATSLFPIQR
jgi:hypothetical protein